MLRGVLKKMVAKKQYPLFFDDKRKILPTHFNLGLPWSSCTSQALARGGAGWGEVQGVSRSKASAALTDARARLHDIAGE
jgi:hypothetical protein